MYDTLVLETLGITDSKVCKEESLYCGDAAGRKQKPFNDFSSDDLLFSVNTGLKFYTPEMLFKGEKLNFNLIPGAKIDKTLSIEESKVSTDDTNLIKKYQDLSKCSKQEVIIAVGSPGAGKSTFWRQYLSKTHERINNDEIKNLKKLQQQFVEYLNKGKSIVIDMTNPSVEKRKEWIDLIKKTHPCLPIKCLYFDIPKE